MSLGPRTMFLFILLLAMPVASWWLMFKPLDQYTAEVRQKTEEKKQKLQEVATKMARTKDMAGEVEELKKALEFVESKLPEEKEYNKVFDEVSHLAEKNGLSSKSVRLLKVVQGADYSEQPIKMVLVGSFQNGFYPFLAEVERLQRLTRIDEMKITADDKVPGQAVVEMVLTIYFDSSRRVAVAQ
jgi:type IV pilus assembly protein PilO